MAADLNEYDWSKFTSHENNNDFWSQQGTDNTYCSCDKLSCTVQGLICFVNLVQLAREFSCDGQDWTGFCKFSVTIHMLSYSQHSSVLPIWLFLRLTRPAFFSAFGKNMGAVIVTDPHQNSKFGSQPRTWWQTGYKRCWVHRLQTV